MLSWLGLKNLRYVVGGRAPWALAILGSTTAASFVKINNKSDGINRISTTFCDGFPRADTSNGLASTSYLFSAKNNNNNASKNHRWLSEKSCQDNKRTFQTTYDIYYQMNGKLAIPKVMHDCLEKYPVCNDSTSSSKLTTKHLQKHNQNQNILVIGDVHGCLLELQRLHQKAKEDYNDGQEFRAVILVGDLVNKGPSSADVVRYVRSRSASKHGKESAKSPSDSMCLWYCVRGNHDNAALKAALGDAERRKKEKYSWVEDLTDEDVAWMSELPYTLRIPNDYVYNCTCLDDGKEKRVEDDCDLDTIIVHAGLIPGIPLEKQDISTMTTLREVNSQLYSGNGDDTDNDADGKQSKKYPWANVWSDGQQSRPYRVIFGHDARRGLQCPAENDLAIGIDTGAVYGGELTALILPSRKIVSVKASKEYCPVNRQ